MPTVSRVKLKPLYYLFCAEHVTLLEQQNSSYDYYVLTDYWHDWHSNMYYFIVFVKIEDSTFFFACSWSENGRKMIKIFIHLFQCYCSDLE